MKFDKLNEIHIDQDIKGQRCEKSMCKAIMSSSSGDETYNNNNNTLNNDSSTTTDERMMTLEEKLQRVNRFLHEIRKLSPKCEEVAPQTENDIKDKQLFSRRILQVSTELQDARDVLYDVCRPPLLSQRQFDFITSEEALENPANDPSIRFFGMDWEQLFAKCLSLSINVRILHGQLLNQSYSSSSSTTIDLVLLSTILKDLASVEVDVSSHGEAVLNGRLSKSQQRIIQQEQAKFNSLSVPAQSFSRKNSTKVSKSQSFRSTHNGNHPHSAQRPVVKYKKNKTTDLHKLSAPPALGPSTATSNSTTTTTTTTTEQPKRKTSFIQNVSSIFKNIR